MKWRCKPETPSRTGASVTLRCVVAYAWSALWRCVCDVMLMDVVITVALVTVTGVTTQVWVSVGVELVLESVERVVRSRAAGVVNDAPVECVSSVGGGRGCRCEMQRCSDSDSRCMSRCVAALLSRCRLPVHRSRCLVCAAQGRGSWLHTLVADSGWRCRRSVVAAARYRLLTTTIADAAASVCVADEMPPPVIDATSRLTSPCTTCRARRRCPSCSGCCCRVGGATLCLPVPSPTRWRRAAPCTVT
jgi:hypothetical protein